MSSAALEDRVDFNVRVNKTKALPREFRVDMGDERKFTLEEAIERAHERASETGVRQQITSVFVSPGDEAIVPRFVIQAI